MKMLTIEKWIKSNTEESRFDKTNDGNVILFVNYEDHKKILRYLNRYKVEYSYDHRCNYETTAFIFK